MKTLHVALLAIAIGGCAETNAETTKKKSYAVKDEAAENRGIEARSDPNAISPEKLEEIDMFFHRKITQLQFECYNSEVEKTHKRYQGNISVALVVNPGGKASDVKLTASSLKSMDDERAKAEGIETCVLDAIKGWEWPDVNAPAPYSGSINFKPAW